ncbi:MAG: RsmB/NOP family class I SAM-dependent RNA methyltransferase [Candidatus Magasanikbacteria bacterium]|nr:RsmB/NOP family class I SAM-dependent RNA methyltransferase [Candidatus Magasanikbacteria bacterium]
MKRKKKGKNGFRKDLPEKFIERASLIFGVSRFREIEKTFVGRPTTFRINSLKSNSAEVLPILSQNGFKVQKISWYPGAFVLLNKSKRELTDLSLYSEGKLYIQSLASMVPPVVLDPKPGERVLDLTAAPGSKTSQITAMMEKKGELVANDKNKVRFFKLKHNMELLGVTQAGELESQPHSNPDPTPTPDPTRASPTLPLQGREYSLPPKEGWRFILRMEHGAQLSREYENYFDKILLDAPCSAEARFDTTDPKSFGYWSERKIKEMAYTQRILLRAAWHMLKPGGVLVYSTCTFAPEENEVQLQKFIERIPDAELLPIALPQLQVAPIATSFKNIAISDSIRKNVFRILPNSQIEGFFVAKITKKVIE